MNVIGLDLSLTSTGIASSRGWTTRVRSHPSAEVTPFSRLRLIREQVLDHTRGADLVVVESLTPHSQTGQHLTRAGLWHLVMEAIDARCITWVEVTNGQVKKYATGRGGAGKDEVLAAVIRRFPNVDVTGNDEADALILAAMGADHLGQPIVVMPTAHRTALAAVKWPEVTRA